MGKRELLLIAGFVVIGALVYQVTAPAREPGQSRFNVGELINHIRREVRGNRSSAEVTMTATYPVPDGIRELRVTLQNTPVTITGEDRTDIASELWVRSTGYDDAEAKSLAGQAVLKVEPAGPAITVGLTYPDAGSQRGRLSLRVPKGMLVQFGPTNVRIEVGGVSGVDLESARGETLLKRIDGRVSVTHRGGELTIEDVGSVRLNARGSDVRLSRVRGEATLELQAGELRGTELLGPIEIEGMAADVTLENLQKATGPLRINAVEGTVVVRGLRSEGRIDGREAEIDVTIDRAAPLAIFNTGDRVQITPPAGGFTLDAVATGGTITLPDAIKGQVTVSGAAEDKDHKAAGAVFGGGPTITIRATRGEIRVNARQDGT